jgi:hypothetical protein
MDAVDAEQAGQQVVPGKENVAAGGRQVIILLVARKIWTMFGHGYHGESIRRRRIG